MNRKALIAVFISSALLVTACTSNLQGKFSTSPVKTTTATKETSSTKTKVATGVKTGSSSSSSSSSSTDSSSSTSTTTSTNPIYETITPSTNTYNTITLSTYDAADEDSQWYEIGKYDYEYSEDATICSEVILMLNDGSTSFQYQSWFDIFSDTRLQFRDADDKFIQYVYPNSATKDRFTVGDIGLPTSGYFYVEVRTPETYESRYKDKKLYVYLSRMCAEKDGDTYLWMNDDGNGENGYFSVTSNVVSGILGGWTKIQD